MNPRVLDVKPGNDYTLILTFQNNEKKVFDVKPYLNMGQFKQLKEIAMFRTVRPCMGSIQWANELDLCPDTLYEDAELISK